VPVGSARLTSHKEAQKLSVPFVAKSIYGYSFTDESANLIRVIRG